MDEILRSVTEHPLVAMAVGVSALLLVYFVLKSLIKLVLILFLIAVVVSGYSYLRDPESKPANLRDAVEKVRTGAGKAADQGKDAYDKSRELIEKGKSVYEKGKEWVDMGKSLLDKGIDMGKETVEKGKETAGDLGKRLGGDRDAGNRQKP